MFTNESSESISLQRRQQLQLKRKLVFTNTSSRRSDNRSFSFLLERIHPGVDRMLARREAEPRDAIPRPTTTKQLPPPIQLTARRGAARGGPARHGAEPKEETTRGRQAAKSGPGVQVIIRQNPFSVILYQYIIERIETR